MAHPNDPRPAPRVGPSRLTGMIDGISLAVAVGSVAGYLDVLSLAIRRQWVEPVVFVGEHVYWTAPLADVILALAVVAGMGILAAILRRRSFWLASFWILTWLAWFGVFYTFPQLHRVAALVLAAGIATITVRWVQPREKKARRGVRVAAMVLGVATAALAGGMLAAEARRGRRAVAALSDPRPDAPNILLIVLDTVRAMSLSLYGYSRETTPNLTRWARRGVTFTNAYSAAPWTLSSHASILTGRWMHELSADWMVPLDGRDPTLGEVLGKAGYRTGGFVANTDYCSAEVGLDRGFGHFEDYTLTPGQLLRSSALWRAVARIETLRRVLGNYDNLGRKTAPEINAAFLRWRARDQRRPYFALLNYYDAHRPYLPPEPWASRFSTPGVRLNTRYRKESGADPNPPPERIQGAIDAYDNAIGYLDDQVGRLLDRLAETGELEHTVVIVTSDHGEEFVEHGVWDHGSTLYGPSVRVPLLILGPSVPAGRTVAAPVSLRDLATTALDLAGSPGSLPGGSLGLQWRSDTAVRSEPILIGVRRVPRQPIAYPVARGDLASVLIGNFRYIRNFGDRTEEVFDQIADPIERQNLIGDPAVQALLPTFRALTDSLFAAGGR